MASATQVEPPLGSTLVEEDDQVRSSDEETQTVPGDPEAVPSSDDAPLINAFETLPRGSGRMSSYAPSADLDALSQHGPSPADGAAAMPLPAEPVGVIDVGSSLEPAQPESTPLSQRGDDGRLGQTATPQDAQLDGHMGARIPRPEEDWHARGRPSSSTSSSSQSSSTSVLLPKSPHPPPPPHLVIILILALFVVVLLQLLFPCPHRSPYILGPSSLSPFSLLLLSSPIVFLVALHAILALRRLLESRPLIGPP